VFAQNVVGLAARIYKHAE
jgi:hypothetical protein